MTLVQASPISAALQDSSATDSLTMELGTLYEPPPVAFSFETIGWSILAGILLILLMVIAFVQIKKYIKNRYRREALRELEKIHEPGVVPQIFVILKRVAIKAFGRERAGNLYGKEWLLFLEKTGSGVQLLAYEKQIREAIYKAEMLGAASTKEIFLNAKKWVATHAGQL